MMFMDFHGQRIREIIMCDAETKNTIENIRNKDA